MNTMTKKEQQEHEKYKKQLFKSIRKRRKAFEKMYREVFGEELWK